MTRLIVLIVVTLIAFAANSVLCRMALGERLLDPISFTSIRLLSALLFLIPAAFICGASDVSKSSGWKEGSWLSGLALFVYAVGFSLAYLWLSSGTGALVLFGAVQITMLVFGYLKGERMKVGQWIGFTIAVFGIIYLVSPGVTAPDPLGAILMLVAGVGWGMYSILGKKVKNPVLATSGNFMRAVLITIVVSLAAMTQIDLSSKGVLIAVICGMVTSGMGYVVWYMTLPKLTTSQASVLQLLVPLLASLGGVILIGESFSLRLWVATVMILGGISLQYLRLTRPKANS